MDALKCQNLDKMRDVKDLYDGFIFGKQKKSISDIWKRGFRGQIP